MAICKHCFIEAGYFNDIHPECQERLDAMSEGLASVTAALMAGRIPRVAFPDLSLVLQDNERPIWFYNNVQEIEQAQRRRFVAGSRGVSIRMMKGVSFRLGATEGTSVRESYKKSVDVGNIILTTKNLYYIGDVDTDIIDLEGVVQFDDNHDIFRIDDRKHRFNFKMKYVHDAMSLKRLVRLVIDLPVDAPLGAPEVKDPNRQTPLAPPSAFPAPTPSPMQRVFGKRKAVPL
ncbi:hypothetical protein ABIE41_002136 [Bosea sp. OAE506]|uniref:hypothetical protein n=1 Tax=Bosea sp. OAE506 TaxID=2663870 RepID=UPI00178C0722